MITLTKSQPDMKINEINRSNLRLINSEIQYALAEVENKFGISIDIGNSRFNSSNYTTKLKIAVVKNGKVKSKKVTDYERLAEYYGITNGAKVGDRVRHPVQKTGYIVEGLNTRAKKYPVNLSTRDGKYKMSVEQFNRFQVVS